MTDDARRSHASHAGGHPGHIKHGDPDPEIRVRALTVVMIVLAVVTVVFAALVWPLSKAFYRAQPAPARTVERLDRSRPAGPLLQVSSAIELEELHSQEQNMLDSYGWVDRGAGIARVPVERALELVLAEGVAAVGPAAVEVRPEAASAPAAPSH